MSDLPSEDHIELAGWENYDESRHADDGLIWLSSEEDAPTPAQTAGCFETSPLHTRDVGGPAAMAASDQTSEDPTSEDPTPLPVLACIPSSNADVRLLQPINSAGDGSAGIFFGSLLTSHKTFERFRLTRRLFRVAALVTVLLIGSVLPSILGHLKPTRVKASAAVAGPSTATKSIGHPMSRPVRVLTVMAGRQETLKDISIRYAGHFDDDLFEEIRKLNPDLRDPDHLEDGQLIRIPLRAATPVN